MANDARHAEQILSQARQSLAHQRAGGRRSGKRSLGRRAAALKREHALRKLLRVGLASGAIILAAMIAGLVIDGIGWTGIIITLLALIGAAVLFGTFPRLALPTRESLGSGSVKSLVGRTELWLEGQRAALPAPAVKLVDHISLQLDALGVQLDGLDEALPAAREVRTLVGEHLPQLVTSYTSIPAHLRAEPRAGRTPDEHLADSLGKISAEIDSVTRQLAAGAIDDLAIQTRFLDYKYGAALDSPEGHP
ncbi:MAG: hypothetical protein RLZZ427_1405 [Pseudomonadota bacterium]